MILLVYLPTKHLDSSALEVLLRLFNIIHFFKNIRMGKPKNRNAKKFNRIDSEGTLHDTRVSKKKDSNLPYFLLGIATVLLVVYLSSGNSAADKKNSAGKGNKKEGHNAATKSDKIHKPKEITDNVGNKYTITRIFDRSYKCYTQGFYLNGKGEWLESCGITGDSTVQRLTQDNANLKFLITDGKKKDLKKEIFGEGIDEIKTANGERIFQLTWQSMEVYEYDQELKLLKTHTLPKVIQEGWGITHDPADPANKVYISDGTINIYEAKIDDKGLTVTRTIPVKDTDGSSMKFTNELEFIKGYIWANVYLTTWIVKIDPSNGKVVRKFNLEYLLNDSKKLKYLSYGDCLNGIAYDVSKKVWYLTGKYWPRVYEVVFDGE